MQDDLATTKEKATERIPVFVLSPPADLEGIFASILTLGAVTQREDAAKQVVMGMRARVARVDALLESAVPRKVFYQLGDHPLMFPCRKDEERG